MDVAKLVRRPRKVQQALRRFPTGRSLSVDEFNRQKLRLPFGVWIADNGAAYLFNPEFELLSIWPAGAKMPEWCDLNWSNVIVQEGGVFYDYRSIHDMGPSNLHYELEALLGAWEMGDRTTAKVLQEWLVSRHVACQELIRACQKEPT
ncbi:hypothetical protein [Skermanella pratensis]|uniref:hypothetical protein n=1 Tax=Skermanella pratensis TaxID=2233999 RepID=UPI001300D368|nr:hypothetical protein [Skermanella pratensis]